MSKQMHCARRAALRSLLLELPAGVALLALGLILTVLPAQAVARAPAGSTGYDISYPQCPSNFPSAGSFAIVGVTNGLPYSAHPCLRAEYDWVPRRSYAPGLCINTANPGPVSAHWSLPGPGNCVDASSYNDKGCAYNYGWNAA